MAALLDVVISMILGGMLLLNVIRAQALVYENSSVYQGDVLVQEMLISQVQIVEGEIRNMGFGLTQGTTAVKAADTSSITFLIDLDRNGVIDTVSYSLGPVSELAKTQNEMDRYLRRTETTPSGTSQGNAGVVTYFHLLYISATNDTLATPVSASNLGSIKEIELSMEVQNPYALYRPQGMVGAGERDALYSTSYWQQTRLASQNLRR
jgi:type II secretory pathway component PulJ